MVGLHVPSVKAVFRKPATGLLYSSYQMLLELGFESWRLFASHNTTFVAEAKVETR